MSEARGSETEVLSSDQKESLYGYWRERGRDEPRILERAQRGGPLRAWAPAAAGLCFGTRSQALRRARYVFANPKYEQLIEGLPRDDVAVIANRVSHLRYARRKGLPVHTVFAQRRALAQNFPRMDRPAALDRSFHALVQDFRGEAGRTLVLQTDSNPINRMILFAAREAGLQTVCIQHGIFQRGSPAHVVDGWQSDFMLAYDPYQVELLVEKGMARERIRVLGFHSAPVALAEGPLPTLREGRARRVCVLGQPWSNFSAEFETRYLEILRASFAALAEQGIDAAFKPHPREKGQAYLDEFGAPFSGSMSDALRSFDVFVSFSSTALLEATLCGRVALQIHDDIFCADRFDEAGYAHTLPAERLDDIATLCRDAAPIANPHLELREPAALAARFEQEVARFDPDSPPHARRA